MNIIKTLLIVIWKVASFERAIDIKWQYTILPFISAPLK